MTPSPPHTHHLADFGLSELLDPGHTHVSNHNKGTPYYVAPETMQHHQVRPGMHGPGAQAMLLLPTWPCSSSDL